ncbi:GNAT family N-acetyltransferase [Tsukamurella sp. NPDC003166]|uniref:GNAT family N-acetyltransferase n=1 Tax=Tsukamurella sp. NPDC003166 TaxID=3154444 RepID=UPI0033B6D548
MDLADVWAPFGLHLRTPRLTLRVVRDEDLPHLAAAVADGIHDPAVMPFRTPWTDRAPAVAPTLLAQYHWSLRARFAPEDWELAFAVLHDGVPIGTQHLAAQRFAELRSVETGSWLARRFHGHGFGTEMRAAVLIFALDHLAAEWATSAAAEWNASSNGVSRALGYRENGVDRIVTRPGVVENMVRLRVSAQDFVRPSWRLETAGVEAIRDYLWGSESPTAPRS